MWRLNLYQWKHCKAKVKVKLKHGKSEATFVSDRLFQWLVVFTNGCDISFDNCKGCEL